MYILERDGHPDPLGFGERPRMEMIKMMGVGDYTLRYPDGRVAAHFHVRVNRNSNLAITRLTPNGLEGVTTAALRLLRRDFERVVKVWPDKRDDLEAVHAELAHRARVVERTIHSTLLETE